MQPPVKSAPTSNPTLNKNDDMRVELAAHILSGLFPSLVSAISEPISQFVPRAELYAEKALITADALLQALERRRAP
jgi:hypothetical protein